MGNTDGFRNEMVFPMTLGEIIISAGDTFNIEAELIAAIILQESSGDFGACRFEPAYKRRYISNKDRRRLGGTWSTEYHKILFEENIRSSSHGLMQIMGQTAIDVGFDPKTLDDWSTILDPATNIYWGSKVYSRYRIGIRAANPSATKDTIRVLTLLRYNGGGNQKYPHEVLERLRNTSAARFLKSNS